MECLLVDLKLIMQVVSIFASLDPHSWNLVNKISNLDKSTVLFIGLVIGIAHINFHSKIVIWTKVQCDLYIYFFHIIMKC